MKACVCRCEEAIPAGRGFSKYWYLGGTEAGSEGSTYPVLTTNVRRSYGFSENERKKILREVLLDRAHEEMHASGGSHDLEFESVKFTARPNQRFPLLSLTPTLPLRERPPQSRVALNLTRLNSNSSSGLMSGEPAA
jgi:hypothetical protein